MSTRGVTIRVSRKTRDLLAKQAGERGISLSAMLAELAERVELDAIYRAEREAARADSGERTVTAEEAQWEAALGDGIR